ncbi:pimeloyl-ACP methyl ester carboxylesterase [Catalinimonas alkaloidigena]|uniref:alpha/beta hydrolase n=1 Tax=Catalinimonas alkaloidigena TaxID=1075417 RepID=UPI0024051902|nr:alpha/beta hydrolase [Catalinimonas alkaloidigena]MDF9795306.1 pimeloyl-ACP methyl ester carboxylesterase [Catalinimonas alkaloidigena]
MKKILYGLAIFALLMAGVYSMGPTPEHGELSGQLPEVPTDLIALEQEVVTQERSNPYIKADNEARIIWADSSKQKTPYSIVYLHGFGASQGEGEPVHRLIAEKYGFNLYLSRLKEQGIESDSAFKSMTTENLLETAKRAVAIGKVLGDKVIIMGTSTGGALGLYITAENPEIAGLILYSPIIAPKDENLLLLNRPWGRQMMEAVAGGEYIIEEREGLQKQYWSRLYYIEGYIALAGLVENAMTAATFAKVKCPVFLGYYYKNEEEQDNVVSVEAMLEMFDQLGTASEDKVKVAFPEAGNHVISSYIRSGDWKGVYHETDNFMRKIFGFSPEKEVIIPEYDESQKPNS